jgi:hypothetical protein
MFSGVAAVVLLAACGAAVQPSATNPPGAVATPAQTAVPTPPPPIHVLEDPVDFAKIPVPTGGDCKTQPCIGEQLVGHSRLLDAATKEVIGTFLVDCELIDPAASLYLCPDNVLNLTGRGQITYVQIFRFVHGAVQDAYPITGGTGEFLGAVGTVTEAPNSTYPYADFLINLSK